jgi:hypothetical protein
MATLELNGASSQWYESTECICITHCAATDGQNDSCVALRMAHAKLFEAASVFAKGGSF